MSTLSVDSRTVIADQFLALLPVLQAQFGIAFHHFGPEQREDALQEATANAFAAYVRLWERGRQQVASPTPLARYAIAHWFAGRRIGTVLNSRDVMSPYTGRRNRILVQRLDRYDSREKAWYEITVEDRRTPVPDQAAFRIDFPAWLQQLSRRNRAIAIKLAEGSTTSEVAQKFRLSWARVSQLRREFQESWSRFHGNVRSETLAA